MIRPFMSSEGILIERTVLSATCSAANRWIDMRVISRDRSWAFCSASSTICWVSAAASCSASTRISAMKASTACSRESPATIAYSSRGFVIRERMSAIKFMKI